ncbi:MAG TPA: helix-turn-helix domain-containing protein [Candidatus Acidoferrales bacterium]|nr:helix-turn-helix domain-containing protein [Candidatus Acidoferrales bacterium]
MDANRLDVRALPVWERPSKIKDIFDRLPVGDSIVIVTENEPRGLAFRMEQARPREIILDHRRIGEHEWEIRLTRASVEADAPSPAGILTRAAIFRTLSEEARSALVAESSLHTIRRGQTAVGENTDWPYVGVVFEGVLALTTGNGNGRPRIFNEIFPYELVGELELFDGAPSAGRVIALSKIARYLRIPRRVVLEVGERNPQLMIELGRVCAQRRRDLMQALATQATMPIIARVAHVLVPYAAPERGLSPARAPLPSLTQAQIAAAAGTVKEVAARAIAELEQRELLKRERGHIRFLDRQGLLDMIRAAG